MSKNNWVEGINPKDSPLVVGLKIAENRASEVPAGGCEIVGNMIVNGFCAEKGMKIITDAEGKCAVDCPFRERLGC